MDNNYEDLFEDWEIAVAKNLINEFRQRQPCLQREGFDDLLQECFAHWLSKRNSYDSAREASPQTFMGRVIRNKLTDLAREREADKRLAAPIAVSLDASLGVDGDSSTLLDEIDESSDASASGGLSLKIELKMDVSQALQKLSPRQREICDLLGEKGLNKKEVSDYLNMPRSTIYDDIKRIRKIFMKEGLGEYLE